MENPETTAIIACSYYLPLGMAKGKSNRILVKLVHEETGEFKVRSFNRQKIDIASYEENGYSRKKRKTVKYKAKKMK